MCPKDLKFTNYYKFISSRVGRNFETISFMEEIEPQRYTDTQRYTGRV